MSRHGYYECHDLWASIRWCGAVKSAMRGQRGDAFLHEMLEALDALPEKKLCCSALFHEGSVCTLGAVATLRKLDIPEDVADAEADEIDLHEDMAEFFGIPKALAAEIMYENDEGSAYLYEKPQQRWARMRRWVVEQIEANKARVEAKP